MGAGAPVFLVSENDLLGAGKRLWIDSKILHLWVSPEMFHDSAVVFMINIESIVRLVRFDNLFAITFNFA